jgi:hypothetical protein
MRKFGLLATVALLAMVLLTSGVGTAAAEPQKNQILVPVNCDNGQSYTLVINGMSKVGQISGGNQNLVVTEYTVTFFQRGTTTNPIGTDTFDRGKAEESNGNSPQRYPISCDGTTTAELEGLGIVRADYEFEGFVTPRGK